MIFSPDLAAKIGLGQKTVTRRPVKRDRAGHVLACTYTPGASYAVQLHRGGFAVDRIAVLDVQRETLEFPIPWSEARAEGFDSPAAFRQKWADLYGPNGPTDVWRIEFTLLSSATTSDGAQAVAPDSASPGSPGGGAVERTQE